MSEYTLPERISDESRAFFHAVRDSRGLRSTVDLKRLEQATELHDRANWCRKEIERLGVTLVDRFGQSKPNPLLDVERKLRATVEQILAGLPDRRPCDQIIAEIAREETP